MIAMQVAGTLVPDTQAPGTRKKLPGQPAPKVGIEAAKHCAD